MEYLFFLRFKGSPWFYKGFDQTFTDIRAISRSHHFELMAAAMAKVIFKKTVPGCARISTVTRRSDKGARRSNSGRGSASSRSSSSSSGVAVAVAGAVAVAVPVAAAAVAAAAVAAASDSSDSSNSKSQQQLPAATSSY